MAEETKIGIKLEEETKPIKKMCEKLMDAVNHELDKGIENIDTKELGEAIDMIKDLYEAKEKLVKSCYYKSVIEAMEEHDFEDEDEIMEEGRRGYRGQPRSESGRFMSRGDGRRSNRGGGRGGRRGYEDMMMYDEDWDEMERMRDMDRMSYGRMGYSGGGSSGGSSGGSQGGQSSGGMSGGSSGGSSGGNSGGGGSRGYSEQGEGGQYSSRMQREGGDRQTSRSENARRGYEETKMMQDNSPEGKKKAMESLENYMKELGEDMTSLVGKMDASEKSMLRTKLQTLAQKVQ